MVHVDGDVTVCCLDEHLENRIGNLRKTPLAKLWDGELINRWRAAHVEGRFEDSGPLCTRCNWQTYLLLVALPAAAVSLVALCRLPESAVWPMPRARDDAAPGSTW